jgi:hypothetical protein
VRVETYFGHNLEAIDASSATISALPATPSRPSGVEVVFYANTSADGGTRVVYCNLGDPSTCVRVARLFWTTGAADYVREAPYRLEDRGAVATFCSPAGTPLSDDNMRCGSAQNGVAMTQAIAGSVDSAIFSDTDYTFTVKMDVQYTAEGASDAPSGTVTKSHSTGGPSVDCY